MQKNRSLNGAVDFKPTKYSNAVSSPDIFCGCADGFSSGLTHEHGVGFLLCFCCVQNGCKPRKKVPGDGSGPVAAEVSGSLSTDLGWLGAQP